MKVLVSACLLGKNCKYSGGNNSCEALLTAIEEGKLEAIPICPEVQGGLLTPRPPAERQGKQVISNVGTDVTEAYRKGAEIALETAKREQCTAAILKARSPSCGSGEIYDGSFSGTVIAGDGVTAELLKASGIAVYHEKNFEQLL